MPYKQTGEIQRAVVVVDTVNPASSVLKTGTPTSAKMETIESEKKGIQASKAGTEKAVISILLVDDHALMREGLRQLLALEEDMRVVAEAVNGLDALQQVRQLRPDVVLMDISMPMVDGIAITRQITQEFPSIAVIILTMYRQQQHVLQAMRNGARGYLLKSASSHELAQAIRAVHNGGMLIEPELTGTLVSEYRRLSDLASNGPSIDTLTEKEIEIIRYVATGMSNREIAQQLIYSEKTVKNYLSIIFQKLGIRDRTQAAIFAFRQGLIADEIY